MGSCIQVYRANSKWAYSSSALPIPSDLHFAEPRAAEVMSGYSITCK
jgi:hypothetical protein